MIAIQVKEEDTDLEEVDHKSEPETEAENVTKREPQQQAEFQAEDDETETIIVSI